MTSYKVIKTITNNIVRARDINDHEVILMGKGIGYGKKTNDVISSISVENTFTLVNETEQQLYRQLIRNTSPKLIEIANEMIAYIHSQVGKPLNEHIHVALTDHIAFLVRRCKMGIPIENPFSLQISTLYSKEYQIAAEVAKQLSERLNLKIPTGEIGFITLHIISSVSDKTMDSLQKENYLIEKLVSIIEAQYGNDINKHSLSYARLITHIRFLIERIQRGEILKAPDDLVDSIRKGYPESYALAWKLIRFLQHELRKTIVESEVFYLSLHLYRFVNSFEAE